MTATYCCGLNFNRSRREQKRKNNRPNKWRAGAPEQPIMHSGVPIQTADDWLLTTRMWTRALIAVYPVLPPQDLVVFRAISRCSRPDQLSSCMSATAQGKDFCFRIDLLRSLLDLTVRTTRAPHTELGRHVARMCFAEGSGRCIRLAEPFFTAALCDNHGVCAGGRAGGKASAEITARRAMLRTKIVHFRIARTPPYRTHRACPSDAHDARSPPLVSLISG